jgi:DeoR family transcriptional regulator, fructose operon transcriptional repressor
MLAQGRSFNRKAATMLVDQRRQKILEITEKSGFVALSELVERVGASESTLRRDLDYLDGIGQIRRTRGGAAYVGDSITPFEVRRTRAKEEKEHIAAVAAALVEPGETVLLDGGTTTLEVARHLVGKPLQVVTNSLPIVNVLMSSPQTELIVIGGFLYPKTGVNLGPIAVAALKSVHARRLFVSAGGVMAAGLFNSNALLVETERQMIESAEELIVVSDSSKLGHSALAHLCPLEVVDRLVVDEGISDEWRQIVDRAGIELIVARS